MYDINNLKRKIAKEGLDNTIQYLLSEELPVTLKNDLEKAHIFKNAYLCLSLLYSLDR